jgi:hypothetical protein
MARAIGLTLAALAAFTAFVLAGGATGIDEWGLDHVMPALDRSATPDEIITATRALSAEFGDPSSQSNNQNAVAN